jgi:predicted Zn-dependent protease with MMP-like domain/Flp pilus assembly protein TadD
MTNIEEEDEVLDPRLEAGWQALTEGDLEKARSAASACATVEALRLDALMLEAACHRDEGNFAAALETLAQVSKGDPDWCEPEMWMAEVLFDQGEDLDEALRHARKALDLAEEEGEYLAALGLKAAVEVALDRPTEARKTLKGLPPPEASLGDAVQAIELSQLLVEVGAPSEARARMETVLKDEPDNADAWYLVGVASDVMGDDTRKREAWVRTRELDLVQDDGPGAAGGGARSAAAVTSAAGRPSSIRSSLPEATLIGMAEETLKELPPEIRSHLANVPIIVADLPAASDVAEGLDPRLLGMFHGAPHAQAGSTGDLPALTEILLFRRNIERVAVDEDDARAEVQLTLLHETGHFFGLDEAALEQLDLG